MKGETLLRTTLKANAVFSAVSGLSLLLFDSFYDRIMGLEYDYAMTGAELMIFATFVWWVAQKRPVKSNLVYVIIFTDAVWVVGSAVVLLSDVGLSALGYWIVGIVALFVADFAIFQFIGIRQSIKQVASSY